MDELYRQYSQIVFHFLYTKCHNPALAEDPALAQKQPHRLRRGGRYTGIRTEYGTRGTFHRAKVRLIKEVSYGKDEL